MVRTVHCATKLAGIQSAMKELDGLIDGLAQAILVTCSSIVKRNPRISFNDSVNARHTVKRAIICINVLFVVFLTVRFSLLLPQLVRFA
jgi:hypothetical protein